MTSRRELLLAGAAALLASPLSAASAQGDDADVVRGALRLEQLLAEAYGDALGRLALGRPLRTTVRMLRDQERQHVQAWLTALREMGASAGGAPGGAEADRIRRAVHGARDAPAFARVALALEDALVAGYVEAHGRLGDTRLLRTTTAVLGDEAQHLVLLRQALGEDPVPTALVTGRGSPPRLSCR